jgi:hypothetical protein
MFYNIIENFVELFPYFVSCILLSTLFFLSSKFVCPLWMNILAPPLHNIVRQLIETGVMSMDFVRLERNLTDHLTKTLARRLVSETSREIGLIPK